MSEYLVERQQQTMYIPAIAAQKEVVKEVVLLEDNGISLESPTTIAPAQPSPDRMGAAVEQTIGEEATVEQTAVQQTPDEEEGQLPDEPVPENPEAVIVTEKDDLLPENQSMDQSHEEMEEERLAERDPLFTAAGRGVLDDLKLALKQHKYGPEAINNALCQGAKFNRLDICKHLMEEYNADPLAPGYIVQNAWGLAARGHLRICKYFAEKGGPEFVKRSNGIETFRVARYCSVSFFRELVDQEAAFDLTKVSSLLYSAVQKREADAVPWLLQIWPNPEVAFENKETALTMAKSAGQFQVYDWLIAFMNDPRKKKANNPIPEPISQTSSAESVRVLGKTMSRELGVAIYTNDRKQFKALMDSSKHKSFDLNAALCQAVRHDRPEMCVILLSKGASMDYIDSCGNTILHVAAEHASHELLKYLLRRAPDINARH
ncbi:ankyrin repeat-containing domain protein [Gorgonomyces haynaldii]|nr:ankyrin repeat-containing domain protein [Gorgonomyces haynaldii]